MTKRTERKTIKRILCTLRDLSEQEQLLVNRAVHARKNAYNPYSRYHVGAAALTAKGVIYEGWNVERATYSETTHAEQSALDKFIKNDREVVAVAIATSHPAFPCGRCRQIIWEFSQSKADVKVIGYGVTTDTVVVSTIGDIFPWAFGPHDLGINPSKE